ncbi:hypothetical protein F1728_05650 [Gimesia benthica]|uniref:Uncharacterized protein n=1 Tax=Gimesia benthica TaxID=2608982 RepID=A0A6I6A712_9PLAN|nr:hypothetical protein [Gimesia benthica]QGQ22204.1 hypothetical protein F1728_05650 [Gimesia benthica]
MKSLETSSTDDLQGHVSDWPVTKSRLGLPHAWAWGIIAVIALVLGIGWLVAANAQNVNPIFTIGSGLGFVFFAFLVLLLLPYQLVNRRFLHATEAVLPEVPRTPLLIATPCANGAITHELEQTPSGIVLKPLDNPYGRMLWFGCLWPLFTGVVMIALVWTHATFADLALFWKAFIALDLCLTVVIYMWFVRRAFRDPPQGLATVEIDQLEKTCVMTSADESISLDVDQIIAVQLCAAWLKIEDLDHQDEDYDNKHMRAEIELNLVWRERPVIESGIERINLLHLTGEFQKLVPLARLLADVLGVPLLNHATSSHWRAEHRLAKDRPYIAVGRARRYPAG